MSAAAKYPDPERFEQAMACLSCGLAGVTPKEHFPQEPGLWVQPCPQCGAETVWVTEIREKPPPSDPAAKSALVTVPQSAATQSPKLKFADVLAAQTSILIRLIRAGLDVRKSNLDDRLLLDRIEDTIVAYREAQP